MAYRLVVAPEQITDVTVILTAPQRHYLQRVLRLQMGDGFMVLDGSGGVWRARLNDVDDGTAQLLETVSERNELPIPVTLAIALPKGSGFEEIIRPCTELGATAFQPLLTERTLLQPSKNKLQRWQRIVTEAAEQSERQWLPPVASPLTFAEFVEEVVGPETLALLCVTRLNSPMLGAYLKQSNLPAQIVLATGPEGGWTDDEISLAIAKGFQPVSLGKRILRAVTAPTVALAQINALLEA
ncbi:Ribosomal RNA small subunit methyltransferase E [Synechocystis sp. PCC 6714]|nr:Ribosomal RNA small subunit methyltransferase E [Synechocystis sp. PCC 6714]